MIGKISRIALALALMASSAHATPPDVMTLSDRIFGVSETQVFLLRTLNDNLGQHIPGMHDVYLVTKNGADGAETLAPVSRTFRGNLNADGEWKGWDVRHYPLSGAVNPFEKLARQNALHVNGPRGEPHHDVTLAEDGLEVSDRGTTTHTMDAAAVQIQIDASIAGTAAFIPTYPPDEGIRSTSTLPFAEVLAEQRYTLAECRPDFAQSLSARRSDQSIMVVRLHCERDWERATLIVVVPPVQ